MHSRCLKRAGETNCGLNEDSCAGVYHSACIAGTERCLCNVKDRNVVVRESKRLQGLVGPRAELISRTEAVCCSGDVQNVGCGADTSGLLPTTWVVDNDRALAEQRNGSSAARMWTRPMPCCQRVEWNAIPEESSGVSREAMDAIALYPRLGRSAGSQWFSTGDQPLMDTQNATTVEYRNALHAWGLR
jgi:hypothetical protein